MRQLMVAQTTGLGHTGIMQSPTVTIHLDTLADNIRNLQKGVSPGCRVMFVVKSDAYGHGIGPVSSRAAAEGIDWFAVAYFEEALEVRKAAPDADILVLGPIHEEEVPACLDQRITPVVVDPDHARALGAAALRCGQPLHVHIKVDTGMGRMGILESGSPEELREMIEAPGLHTTGICSHLATVDLKRPWPQEKQHTRFVRAYTIAEEIAGRLARGPSVAYRYMKENFARAMSSGDVDDCLDLEATHHVHCGRTEDHRNATKAFVEKREPVFHGR